MTDNYRSRCCEHLSLLNAIPDCPKIEVMSIGLATPTPSTPSLFNSWETVRCELLHTRVCDLGLKIEGSPLEPFIERLDR